MELGTFSQGRTQEWRSVLAGINCSLRPRQMARKAMLPWRRRQNFTRSWLKERFQTRKRRKSTVSIFCIRVLWRMRVMRWKLREEVEGDMMGKLRRAFVILQARNRREDLEETVSANKSTGNSSGK